MGACFDLKKSAHGRACDLAAHAFLFSPITLEK
jgi:hypothetical protein